VEVCALALHIYLVRSGSRRISLGSTKDCESADHLMHCKQ
jgi:hypothetical protein